MSPSCQTGRYGPGPKADTRKPRDREGRSCPDGPRSVTPKFQKQIAKGGPMEVVHAGITRFLMTPSPKQRHSCRRH
ncbi:polysaccharide biosynthesis protein [Caballeronia sp. SBC1]|uniref:polysaccharide biosynthesis protein n=1 Tax=Caballeronia sp. SBC1 TaxID=2705548 RepID=UPI00353043D1